VATFAYTSSAGADASCSLGWVINKLEAAGFEVQNIDVLGVHYAATLYRCALVRCGSDGRLTACRWYKNWLSNKDKVIARYGERLYRVWVYFLASSVITARCAVRMRSRNWLTNAAAKEVPRSFRCVCSAEQVLD
jgi:cyclopropane fatty-acyl-phospholipid synthase-like methyltransferase